MFLQQEADVCIASNLGLSGVRKLVIRYPMTQETISFFFFGGGGGGVENNQRRPTVKKTGAILPLILSKAIKKTASAKKLIRKS